MKPDNVILRGSEAVLIDFDVSRIHKTAISEDTKILGTTGFARRSKVRPLSVGWPRRYLCAGCTAQYYADGRAPLKEACRRRMGRIDTFFTMVNPEKGAAILYLMGIIIWKIIGKKCMCK